MVRLQIIGGPRSNFVWVTRIVLAEKGAAYENVAVPPHTPQVDAIHPFGKIPVMRHGEFTLCESRAICAYLDRAYPGKSLVPDDPELAAQTEQWISLICTTIDPVVIRQYVAAYMFPGTPDGSPNRPVIDKVMPAVERHLGIVEQAVVSGYLVGNQFTLADAYLFPILYYLSKMPESAAAIGRSPALKGYLARHETRPSIRDTTPQPISASERETLQAIARRAAAG